MEKQTIQVDLPENLRMYRDAFETAYEEKSVIYHQIQSYFDDDINRILARKDVTVFDVGANVGLFSMEVLRRTEGRAQIHTFEPVPDTFAKLEKNFGAMRSAFPNIHLYNLGLGEDDLTVTFQHSPFVASMSSRYDMFSTEDSQMALSIIYNPRLAEKFHMNVPPLMRRLPRFANLAILAVMNFIFRHIVGKPQPVECKLTTLSKIVSEQKIEHIDLLKIDVEKAEMDVLQGIAETDWPKIDAIALEVHDIAGREQKIRQLLARHGFDQISVDKEEEGQLAFGMAAFRSSSLQTSALS